MSNFLFHLQERSRSPPPVRSYSERYHYDDPRRELREEEMYRQRIREETRSSSLTSDMRYTSPLQGTKSKKKIRNIMCKKKTYTIRI